MEFEWDARKNERNISERGIPFEYVVRVFDGPMTVWIDDRRSYGEERFVGIGELDGRCFVVVWTKRGPNVYRLISARKANERETQRHKGA
jgi:hypothetical protein